MTRLHNGVLNTCAAAARWEEAGVGDLPIPDWDPGDNCHRFICNVLFCYVNLPCVFVVPYH